MDNRQILVLSNGHGEDAIAASIIEKLQDLPNSPQISALPLVGEGHAYKRLRIPLVGDVQSMPSGGFIYMDTQQFWRDVQGGLIQLTYQQYQVIRQWGKNGGKVLAVGDIFPLLLAYLSGADYGFVGTAKSEYHWRDETDWLPQTSKWVRWIGSAYFPWERWLMAHYRCLGVFPRDSLTAQVLERWPIRVFDVGNPMMDDIKVEEELSPFDKRSNNTLTLVLLPGSRMPEAQRNWQVMLEAIQGIIKTFSQQSLVFLAAIAPALSLDPFARDLTAQGWIWQPLEITETPLKDPDALAFTHPQGKLILSQNAYEDCLHRGDLAIAMAGTATEQFVGLGKPAITIMGSGPQFTRSFAIAQTHLLGDSVILVEQPSQVSEVINSLLKDPQRLQEIAENGQQRMGKPGASQRIAERLVKIFFD